MRFPKFLQSWRWQCSIAGLMVAVAIGLAIVFVMPKRLTWSEFERIARAEIAARDPSFPKDAIATYEGKTYASRYQMVPEYWEIRLKRRDAPTGYLVRLYDRDRIQIGSMTFGPGLSAHGQFHGIEPMLVRSP